MEAALAALGNRVFLMNNVHDNAPVVFESSVGAFVFVWAADEGPNQNVDGPGAVETSVCEKRRGVGRAVGRQPRRLRMALSRKRLGAAAPASSNRPVVPAGIREKFRDD